MAKELRTARLDLRLTENEKAALQDSARHRNMTVTEFLLYAASSIK